MLVWKNALRLLLGLCALIGLQAHPAVLHSDTKVPFKKSSAADLCSTDNISLTRIQPAFSEDKKSGLLQLPVLLIDIPLALLENGYWKALKSPQGRVDMITKSIQEQAAANPQIADRIKKGELSISAIKGIAAQLAEPYRGGAFPDHLVLSKEATYRVVQLLVKDQLRLLDLPCNSEKDFAALSAYLLQGFKSCLDSAKDTDEYSGCVKSISNSIHFNVGQAALQILLRENLKSIYPHTADGQKQMKATLQQALQYYNDCAFERVLPYSVQDKETQVKVCAAEAIFRSVHSYAETKMEGELKSLGKNAEQIDAFRQSIFDTLKNPPCPFADQLKNTGKYTAAQYSGIESIFVAKAGKKPVGFDQLKSALLVCANSLTTQAGAVIVKEKVKTQPMLLAQYPDAKADFIDHLADEAVAKAYLPCIQRQLANKDKSGALHMVDPKACEDSIVAYLGLPILANKIPTQLDKALENFHDEGLNSPEIVQEAKRMKEAALASYNGCIAKPIAIDQRALLNCLQSTIQQFAADYSSLYVQKVLGHKLSKEDAEIDSELRSLAISCVQNKLANVKELGQVQSALNGIGEACSLQISKQMLAKVAKIKVKDIFTSQKLSSAEFMRTQFPLQVYRLNNDLAAAKNPQDEQLALDSFQTRLSWDVLNSIATVKTESMAPLLDEKSGLPPYRVQAHNEQVLRLRQDIEGYLHQNESEFLVITDAKTRDQRLNEIQQQVTLKLADYMLRKNLAKFNFEEAIAIKSQLIAELKNCMADPKNKNCSDKLVENATWLVYTHTVDSQVSSAIIDVREKDPVHADEIIQSIHDKFLDKKTEAQLKAVANDDKKRDELLREIQIEIATEIADRFVSDAMKKYYSGPGAVEFDSNYKKQLKECLAKVLDPFGSPAFAEKIKKCAIEIAAHTAINLGVEREKTYLSRSAHPAMGIPARVAPTAVPVSSVDVLARYTADACFYLRDNCAQGVKALHAEIDNYLAKNPNTSADNLVLHIKKSDAMDFLVEGALAKELEKKLVEKMLPLKDPADKFDHMETAIYEISSGAFIGPLLQEDKKKNGEKSFLFYVKDRMAASRTYNPSTDPRVQEWFKSLLLADVGEGSLTDRVLEVFARSTYQDSVKGEKDSFWWFTKTLFVSSDMGNYRRAIIKTKSGLAAREYFLKNVLAPMISEGKTFSASEMNAFRSALHDLLYKAATEIPYGKE